jgi:hypothetical protein
MVLLIDFIHEIVIAFSQSSSTRNIDYQKRFHALEFLQIKVFAFNSFEGMLKKLFIYFPLHIYNYTRYVGQLSIK